MIQIELDSRSRQTLHQVLESYLAELREEIGDTDDFEFRGILKERLEMLMRIVQQLEKDGGLE